MTRLHRPTPRQRPSLQGGFTLIELMIALLLGLLVIGGVVSVFLSNKQAYTTSSALSQVQDNSRVAFEMLARDIRETGLTGCGNIGRVGNILNNGPVGGGTAWYADMGNAVHGYDASTTDPAVTSGTSAGQRVAAASSIQLVGADGSGVSIASDSTTASKMVINESSSNIASGDLVVICDPDHAVLAQATTYTAGTSPNFVMSTTGSPGNCSTGLGYPTVCTSTGNVYQYAVNAQVSKLYAADWYIGYNPVGSTSLYRMTLINSGGVPTPTAQEMVRNVSGMTISYHVAGNASYGNAAAVTNWSQVDSVILAFQLKSASQYTSTTQQQLARQINMTVTLRNRV
jgi:type IV pilus assembly protein PilW